MAADNFRNLAVYKKAFSLAMEIFQISKAFPKEERYSLTDQIRRSSRSVCSSVGEAYRKRQYEAYFVSKASDRDSENTETRVWLDFSKACSYISHEVWWNLEQKAEEVGRLLNHMIENPKDYQRKLKPQKPKAGMKKEQAKPEEGSGPANLQPDATATSKTGYTR